MREYSDYQCDQDDDEPEAPLPPGWLEGEKTNVTAAFTRCPVTAKAQAYPLIDYHTNSWGLQPGCVHLELRLSAQAGDVIFVDAERKDGVVAIKLHGPYKMTDATPEGYTGLKVIEVREY